MWFYISLVLYIYRYLQSDCQRNMNQVHVILSTDYLWICEMRFETTEGNFLGATTRYSLEPETAQLGNGKHLWESNVKLLHWSKSVC